MHSSLPRTPTLLIRNVYCAKKIFCTNCLNADSINLRGLHKKSQKSKMHLNVESVSQYTQFAASLCWLNLECCHYSILFIHKTQREKSMMRFLIIEVAGRVGDQHQILNFSWPKSFVNTPYWETRRSLASWRKSSSSGCRERIVYNRSTAFWDWSWGREVVQKHWRGVRCATVACMICILHLEVLW